MKKTALQLLLFFIFHSSYAQLTPEDKLGIWYDLGGNHKISKKASIETYTQFWLYEINNDFNFFLLKLGYTYQFNSSFTGTLYLGYSDFDENINSSLSHTYERRITEQMVFKHKINKTPIDHRFRIEHRFFQKDNSKSKIARLRYRIGSKVELGSALFLRLHDELLLTPKSTNTPENRFYIGIGFNMTPSSNLQFGYMNRHTSNNENLHRLQVGLFFKTDFTKKKES